MQPYALFGAFTRTAQSYTHRYHLFIMMIIMVINENDEIWLIPHLFLNFFVICTIYNGILYVFIFLAKKNKLNSVF